MPGIYQLLLETMDRLKKNEKNYLGQDVTSVKKKMAADVADVDAFPKKIQNISTFVTIQDMYDLLEKMQNTFLEIKSILDPNSQKKGKLLRIYVLSLRMFDAILLRFEDMVFFMATILSRMNEGIGMDEKKYSSMSSFINVPCLDLFLNSHADFHAKLAENSEIVFSILNDLVHPDILKRWNTNDYGITHASIYDLFLVQIAQLWRLLAFYGSMTCIKPFGPYISKEEREKIVTYLEKIEKQYEHTEKMVEANTISQNAMHALKKIKIYLTDRLTTLKEIEDHPLQGTFNVVKIEENFDEIKQCSKENSLECIKKMIYFFRIFDLDDLTEYLKNEQMDFFVEWLNALNQKLVLDEIIKKPEWLSLLYEFQTTVCNLAPFFPWHYDKNNKHDMKTMDMTIDIIKNLHDKGYFKLFDYANLWMKLCFAVVALYQSTVTHLSNCPEYEARVYFNSQNNENFNVFKQKYVPFITHMNELIEYYDVKNNTKSKKKKTGVPTEYKSDVHDEVTSYFLQLEKLKIVLETCFFLNDKSELEYIDDTINRLNNVQFFTNETIPVSEKEESQKSQGSKIKNKKANKKQKKQNYSGQKQQKELELKKIEHTEKDLDGQFIAPEESVSFSQGKVPNVLGTLRKYLFTQTLTDFALHHYFHLSFQTNISALSDLLEKGIEEKKYFDVQTLRMVAFNYAFLNGGRYEAEVLKILQDFVKIPFALKELDPSTSWIVDMNSAIKEREYDDASMYVKRLIKLSTNHFIIALPRVFLYMTTIMLKDKENPDKYYPVALKMWRYVEKLDELNELREKMQDNLMKMEHRKILSLFNDSEKEKFFNASVLRQKASLYEEDGHICMDLHGQLKLTAEILLNEIFAKENITLILIPGKGLHNDTGENELFQFVTSYLKKRNIEYSIPENNKGRVVCTYMAPMIEEEKSPRSNSIFNRNNNSKPNLSGLNNVKQCGFF